MFSTTGFNVLVHDKNDETNNMKPNVVGTGAQFTTTNSAYHTDR